MRHTPPMRPAASVMIGGSKRSAGWPSHQERLDGPKAVDFQVGGERGDALVVETPGKVVEAVGVSLRQRLVDRCLNFDDGHLHDRTRLRRDSCWHLIHNNVAAVAFISALLDLADVTARRFTNG